MRKPYTKAILARRCATLREIERLFIEQGGLCFLCEQPAEHPDIDHVMPKARSSRNFHGAFRNKVMTCMACNRGKADRMPSPDEIERLRLLKEPYAEVDYTLSMIVPATRTNWLKASRS